MPKMPTLGYEPKKSGSGKMVLILICAGAAFGGYWLRGRHDQHVAKVAPAPAPSPAATASTAPGSAAPTAPAPTAPAALAEQTPSPSPSPAAAPEPSGPKHVSVIVDGPLETSLATKVGPQLGPVLGQVVTRALVWWMHIPRDLVRGDKLDVVYEERGGEEPQVDAVRLVSAKYGKTFEAYRFQPPGEPYSRFYQPDGEELEKRLESSPLDTYEQITSLIKDGRHHKGVDFKTPVGTPVRATFAGTITRKNWKWRLNGNCMELTEAASPHRKIYYLHLSPIPKTLLPGKVVHAGEVIAGSGNTGHSFAPHLHYQLMSPDDQVLDPFESQPSYRRKLPASQRPALEAQISRWEALMGTAVASSHN